MESLLLVVGLVFQVALQDLLLPNATGPARATGLPRLGALAAGGCPTHQVLGDRAVEVLHGG